MFRENPKKYREVGLNMFDPTVLFYRFVADHATTEYCHRYNKETGSKIGETGVPTNLERHRVFECSCPQYLETLPACPQWIKPVSGESGPDLFTLMIKYRTPGDALKSARDNEEKALLESVIHQFAAAPSHRPVLVQFKCVEALKDVQHAAKTAQFLAREYTVPFPPSIRKLREKIGKSNGSVVATLKRPLPVVLTYESCFSDAAKSNRTVRALEKRQWLAEWSIGIVALFNPKTKVPGERATKNLWPTRLLGQHNVFAVMDRDDFDLKPDKGTLIE